MAGTFDEFHFHNRARQRPDRDTPPRFRRQAKSPPCSSRLLGPGEKRFLNKCSVVKSYERNLPYHASRTAVGAQWRERRSSLGGGPLREGIQRELSFATTDYLRLPRRRHLPLAATGVGGNRSAQAEPSIIRTYTEIFVLTIELLNA